MKQQILSLILKPVLGASLLLAFSGSSNASLITFTIPNGLNTQGTVTIVSSGTTLNLFNPVDAFGNTGTFESFSSEGLFFSNQAGGLHDFNFTFDKYVGIVSYEVGNVPNGDTGSFDLSSSPGSGSSLNNAVGFIGSSIIVGSFELDTFQTGFFDTFEIVDGSSGNGFPPFYQILSITVDDFEVATVPVPAAVWLFGSGLLGLIGVARRKRAV